MKLQLNHIQHYPIGKNGLKFKWDDSDELWGIHYESGTDYDKMLYPISTLIFTIGKQSEEKLGWKLVLHNLSDLTKPIKVEGYNDGKEFVPAEKIQSEYPGEAIGLNPATWTHRVVEKLFEWHFDVFGLIKEGLAVDKNTLK